MTITFRANHLSQPRSLRAQAVVYGEGAAKDVTGNGHFMETQVWLDTATGHCEAVTHTWCINWVFGFTGSVGIIFLGADGRPLGHSEAQAFGVDARGVFFKASSRTDNWATDLDPAMTQQVEAMMVIHSHAPRNRLGDILAEIGSMTDVVTKFCEQNPRLCEEVGGLFA